MENTVNAPANDQGSRTPDPGLQFQDNLSNPAPEQPQDATRPGTENGGGLLAATPATEGQPPAAENGSAVPADRKDPGDLPFKGGELPDLGFPEHIDPQIKEQFGKLSQEIGLTPNQMAGLVKWQQDTLAASQEAALSSGLRTLNEEWGPNARTYQRQAVALIAHIDEQLAAHGEGSFSKAIASHGIGYDLNFVRGLHVIASALGEDTLNTPHSAASRTGEEDPAEAIAKMFRQGV